MLHTLTCCCKMRARGGAGATRVMLLELRSAREDTLKQLVVLACAAGEVLAAAPGASLKQLSVPAAAGAGKVASGLLAAGSLKEVVDPATDFRVRFAVGSASSKSLQNGDHATTTMPRHTCSHVIATRSQFCVQKSIDSTSAVRRSTSSSLRSRQA